MPRTPGLAPGADPTVDPNHAGIPWEGGPCPPKAMAQITEGGDGGGGRRTTANWLVGGSTAHRDNIRRSGQPLTLISGDPNSRPE